LTVICHRIKEFEADLEKYRQFLDQANRQDPLFPIAKSRYDLGLPARLKLISDTQTQLQLTPEEREKLLKRVHELQQAFDQVQAS
jgi:hypothetical protein